MSREDIGLPGYEPGNGFRPADFGFSLRDFRKVLPYVATYVAIAVLRSYLGDRAAAVLLGAMTGALLLVGGTRHILYAERYGRGKTEKGARQLRIAGIVMIVIGTAALTLGVGYIVFVAEGW
jgi:hypothetical protein